MNWSACKSLFRKPSGRKPQFQRRRLIVEQLEPRLAPSANVLSYHNDASSTGANLGETLLTPANVNPTDFGKLFSANVDGAIAAQPLIVSGVNITTGPSPGVHNVAYVATEHDSLYAFDADSGALLWQRSCLRLDAAGNPIETPAPLAISASPVVGITGTPVIDPATNTIYFDVATETITGNHYLHLLYALDIASGNNKFGGPQVIADTIAIANKPGQPDPYTYTFVSGPWVNGYGVGSVNGIINFNAFRHLQRPGLTLANGTVYIAYGSFGDVDPYHGWVLGFNASTLQLTAVFNTTPNGGEGSIWQSGGALAADPQGNLYFMTGNGTFDGTSATTGLDPNHFPYLGDYGDSFIKLAVDPTTTAAHQNINGWGLKVVDYFTPSNQEVLTDFDFDLGSGAPLLLPDSAGSPAHPHLLVGAGKEGRIYLLDQDNMGKFDQGTSTNPDLVVQESPPQAVGTQNGTGFYGTPAYFNNTLYFVGSGEIPLIVTLDNDADTAAETDQETYTESDPASGSTATGAGYGGSFRYIAAGSSSWASWQFTYVNSQAKDDDLQVTWVPASTNTKMAQYNIYDGATLLNTIFLDQTKAPSGVNHNGSVFQDLGTYLIPDGQVTVTVSNALAGQPNAGATVADAVQLSIVNPNPEVAKAFSISNAAFSASPISLSPDGYGYPGSTPSISANGTSNGIAWDLVKLSNSPSGSMALRAYDAGSYGTELYTSDQAPDNRDQLGLVTTFAVPTVANGKVYVGASDNFVVYGLLQLPPFQVYDVPGQGVFLSDAQGRLSHITGYDPSAIAWNAKGLLVGEFPGQGVFVYNGSWVRITAYDASQVDIDANGIVAAEFPHQGVFVYNGAWSRITTFNASQVRIADGIVAADFSGQGVFLYNGGWDRITTYDASSIDLDANGDFVGEFQKQGVFLYDGGWSRITTSNASQVRIAGGLVAAEFKGKGVFLFNGGWDQITSFDASDIDLDTAGTFLGSFPGQGVFVYADGQWERLSKL